MNFKTEREQRGLTQTEVARSMGMLPGDYCKIEAGTVRKPTKIQKKFFGLLMQIHDLGIWESVTR
jgi:transcriptional regulator with XRE-family HTH domain